MPDRLKSAFFSSLGAYFRYVCIELLALAFEITELSSPDSTTAVAKTHIRSSCVYVSLKVISFWSIIRPNSLHSFVLGAIFCRSHLLRYDTE